jgi:hypothetical protein
MLGSRFRMPFSRKPSRDGTSSYREALEALVRRRPPMSTRGRRLVLMVTSLAMVAALLAVLQLEPRGNGDRRAAPGTPAVKAGPRPERSTATSTTRQNKDGSFTTTVHNVPVNYRAPDGTFQPIDTKLHPISADGYAWRAGPNAFGVRFKDVTDSGFTEVRIGNRTFRVTADGAAARKSTVDGARITYAQAYRSADLACTVTTTGVKEVVELAGPDAPTSYTFRLVPDQGPAPSAQRNPDGSWAVLVPGLSAPAFVLDAALAENFIRPGQAA